MAKRFIVATHDYSGLGIAKKLQDEGYEVLLAVNTPNFEDDSERARFANVGNGIVTKVDLKSIFEKRSDYKDWYWIWDFNHNVTFSQTLHEEKFKILGGGKHAEKMEHDRNACLEFVSQFGLRSPPTFEFDNMKDAIIHCEKNPRTAYVFKPNVGDKYETFLPENEDPVLANIELRSHLESNGNSSSFILQERKDGVETNVEVWFQRGEPVFAFMTLECKRKNVFDLGPLMGCAFDFAFTIPLDCKAVQDSVGKLYPAYKEMKYTGFADANFIASRDGIWFFEKCERFGYNSHPNLFLNLALKGMGTILSSLIDGHFTNCFSGGFGASITMSTIPNHSAGKVIHFPSRIKKDIYMWDAYVENDRTLISGYDHEGDVLIVTGYGYTIPTAWEKTIKKAGEIRFPYRQYRTDGADTNFPTSPIRRYEALKAMGYI
jgi:phosphoribosylamine-glycine ligase